MAEILLLVFVDSVILRPCSRVARPCHRTVDKYGTPRLARPRLKSLRVYFVDQRGRQVCRSGGSFQLGSVDIASCFPSQPRCQSSSGGISSMISSHDRVAAFGPSRRVPPETYQCVGCKTRLEVCHHEKTHFEHSRNSHPRRS